MFTSWIIPLVVAVLLLALLFSVQNIQNKFWLTRGRRYRWRYLQLVHRAENLCLTLNDWAPLITNLNPRSEVNENILKTYASLLHQFESLLVVFKDIAPFGEDMYQINWAHFLINESTTKVSAFQKQLDQHIHGHKGEAFTASNIKKITAQIALGCYFCSRPFTHGGLTKVRVKFEHEVRQVYSCGTCKQALEKDKRVKILFFIIEGESKHWSEVKDYNPIRDYWHINDKTSVRQTVKLELISTHDSKE